MKDEQRKRFLAVLDGMYARFTALKRRVTDPDEVRRPGYKAYIREYGRLEKVMGLYERYRVLASRVEEDRQILEDDTAEEELKEMAVEEIRAREGELGRILEEIKDRLFLDDAGGDKVIFEIRAGTGGEEACLFAGDLFRMYTRYCDRKGWKYEILDSGESDLKGFRHVIFSVAGRGAYPVLRYESGGHRVQRVPVTESGGRIHTSAATVAVLPEAEEIEVKIDPRDLEIDTFRSSGPGGQSVNTMDSAVRIRHKPTGIVASCQDGKSQHANKEKAMRILVTRVYERMKQEQERERGDLRRRLIGSGDRNERIRTYNFPQNRVTDHRIDYTAYNLDMVMAGELDELLARLQEYFKERYFEEYEYVL